MMAKRASFLDKAKCNIFAKLIFLCLAAGAIVLLHYYCHKDIYLQCLYQQNLIEINPKVNIISSGHIRNHSCSDDKDKACNEPSQAEEKPKFKNETNQTKENTTNIGINTTHINGILMEPVNVNYSRNIYFTVKTTHKYYTDRLLLIMLTWLQTVDKNKVSIITDRSHNKQIYVDMIRKAGFHIIDTSCKAAYDNSALCCKLAYELDAYYTAVEQHPGKEDKYEWFCHIDDDVYVNIIQLSQLLQQYDPNKPYYLGKWASKPWGKLHSVPLKKSRMEHFLNKTHYTIKQTSSYRFATGATYCISYDLMMKAKKFFHPETFLNISTEAHTIADDMTVGFIIEMLLGFKLTDANVMTNQYDSYVKRSSLKKLIKYPTVSKTIIENNGLKKAASSLKTPLPPDPTKFMLYHCLLYPNVSWCHSIREVAT